MGAWCGYGLGTECEDLPGFVVLNGGLIPPGGIDNFAAGFLPASYQGSVFQPNDKPVVNIQRREASAALQEKKLALLRRIDAAGTGQLGASDQVESAIANYELAYRMQIGIPQLVDFSDETPATLSAYGLDAEFEPTKIFARQCLVARRLAERGVRFIELTCPKTLGDRWDQHWKLKHEFATKTTPGLSISRSGPCWAI